MWFYNTVPSTVGNFFLRDFTTKIEHSSVLVTRRTSENESSTMMLMMTVLKSTALSTISTTSSPGLSDAVVGTLDLEVAIGMCIGKTIHRVVTDVEGTSRFVGTLVDKMGMSRDRDPLVEIGMLGTPSDGVGMLRVLGTLLERLEMLGSLVGDTGVL